MKIYKFLLLFASLAPNICYSQIADAKVNLLAGAVTIFNPSLEVGVGERSAIAVDYVGAYSRENFMGTGSPFILSMGVAEYRRYLIDGDHRGLFVGGDFGLDFFRMVKSRALLVSNTCDDGSYDVGYGYLFGVSVGYKYLFRERWSLEASLSGGYHNAQHERYSADGVRLVDFNASGEWVLYKAGIYLGYRFNR